MSEPIILPAEHEPVEETVTLTIDGREITVPKGELVIRAAERLGVVIPRFCDHPLLDPAGACRQCIVEIEGQAKPMTSCTTECQDDMVVRTHVTSEMAEKAQEAQLEFLLINHPLDCPMCDKGGECPLQDQALEHGPGLSRFVDEKRRYEKPVAVSPNVLLDRERCVLCARCTRFASQISGDPFIELFERGALQQVAIYEDEPYVSYFSGNVIQICPVGALTSASYRFRARPFDLESRPGVCNLCSAGCNLNLHVRRGGVMRQLARTNMAVNEAWNCDKGRFAFKYLEHERRLTEPAVRRGGGRPDGELVPVSWTEALDAAAGALRDAIREGSGRVAVLTGGRLPDEDAHALAKYARLVLGTNDVDFRTWSAGSGEDAALAQVAGRPAATYDDVERAPLVLLVGLDPEEEVPILYLRLRKGWLKRGTTLAALGPRAGSIAELLTHRARTRPGGEADALDELARAVRDGEAAGIPLARTFAQAGGDAVVLVGERGASSPGTLAAAGRLADTVGAKLAWVPRRNNARGALDAGLLPGLLPGGRRVDGDGREDVESVWGAVPDREGRSLEGILEAAAAGELDVLHLVGVDLVRDCDRPDLALEALGRVGTVIVQDLLDTETAGFADVVLPAADAHERDGTFTNWEGRRQRFRAAVPMPELAQEDWGIVSQLSAVLGHELGFETLEDVRAEMSALAPVATPAAWPPAETAGAADDDRGPDGDGEYELVTYPLLLDAGAMSWGADDMLKTAKTPFLAMNRADAERAGIAHGDTARVVGPGGDLTLPVQVEDDVARGVVFVPRNSTPSPTPDALGVSTSGPLRVDVERVDERVVAMFGGRERRPGADGRDVERGTQDPAETPAPDWPHGSAGVPDHRRLAPGDAGQGGEENR